MRIGEIPTGQATLAQTLHSEQVPQPEKVTLLLRQHIGASAIACVQKGDRVVHGQCVGQIPHGTLGAPIHASIGGMVSDVTENAITLVRG